MRLYKNPIIRGFHPDPSICRVNNEYFLVTSSFEYFPGVPIFHSRDLINWDLIGYCLTRDSQLNLAKAPSSGGIFAPTIRYHNGVFYMITTNINHGGIFYVKTEDPYRGWSDPVYININGYDPSLYFEEDGTVLLTYSDGRKIMQVEINLENGKLKSDPKAIWNGTGGQAPEGPHLYKIKDYYYLLIAEGGTGYGHMVTIARSKSPWGPFESCYRNPILTHRSLDNPIQCVGHADLFQAHDGSWWIVCLGTRPFGYPPKSNLGRETFLAPVSWDYDGWPIIGNNGKIELEMEAPSFYQGERIWGRIFDDFNNDKLNLYWNFRRNPDIELYSLNYRKGYLTLRCGETTLDDESKLAFIGIRQEDFNCEVRTKVEFDPKSDNEEAGLTIFLSENFHYDIAISTRDGKKCIVFKRNIASLKDERILNIEKDKPVILGIKANQKYYYFYFDIDGNKTNIGKGETFLLTTEVGGKFTGNYFGLYATGNGKRTLTPAYFDWVEYVRYKEYVEYTKLKDIINDEKAFGILLKYIPNTNIINQIMQYIPDTNLGFLLLILQRTNIDIDIENLIFDLSNLP
ncbi:MAG: glycoside hydrolase family 43 protein, partial [Candidatus Methanomethylicia archaeon]